MTHVIVHAGYHKTGTTSLQDFMAANRAALAPHLAYYGKMDFEGAGTAARIYAQRPYPWRLARFRRALRGFLGALPETDTIVLSRETFSGGMPGHRQATGALMTSYHGPALKLAQAIITELRRRFGREVEITFFYTTRAREDWIKSVHGHLLRSIRLTQDLDAFRANFPALASPEEEARRMTGALDPIPVAIARLESWSHTPEGPAGALLDLAGVPAQTRAHLAPVPRGNIGQNADLRAEFLRLNRSSLSDSDLRAAKARLLHARETRRSAD